MPTQRPSKPKPRARRSATEQEEGRAAPGLRWPTIIVTNLSKLFGIALAVNELWIRPEARQSALAFCALLVIGSQATEDVLLKIIDRVFSVDQE